MAENYGWVDPNTGDRLPIGVGGGTLASLNQARPDWQTDGLGLRGAQPDRPIGANAKPHDMNFLVSERKGFSEPSGGGSIDAAVEAFGDLTPGETEVDNLARMTFDSRYFVIHDNGGGEVRVSLNTATC